MPLHTMFLQYNHCYCSATDQHPATDSEWLIPTQAGLFCTCIILQADYVSIWCHNHHNHRQNISNTAIYTTSISYYEHLHHIWNDYTKKKKNKALQQESAIDLMERDYASLRITADNSNTTSNICPRQKKCKVRTSHMKLLNLSELKERLLTLSKQINKLFLYLVGFHGNQHDPSEVIHQFNFWCYLLFCLFRKPGRFYVNNSKPLDKHFLDNHTIL